MDSIAKYKEVQFIDPEELFKAKFSISSLSVLTCTLRDIDKNQIQRFYKKELVEINNNNILEQYLILEINKLKRSIKVKSINYNKDFIVLINFFIFVNFHSFCFARNVASYNAYSSRQSRLQEAVS